jgi:hypothetical protein
MKIVIPGGTGQIGAILCRAFSPPTTRSLCLVEMPLRYPHVDPSNGMARLFVTGRRNSKAQTLSSISQAKVSIVATATEQA